MRLLGMLVLGVASIFCVANRGLAQVTYPASPTAQVVNRPVITYGTPTVVQSTPITSYSPVVGSSASQTVGTAAAPVRAYSPAVPSVTAAMPVAQSTPVAAYYPAAPVAAPVVTYRPVVPRGAVINYRPFIPATQVNLSPAPVVSYRPVISGVAPVVAYRPVAVAPVVSYRPVAVAPVVTYRPVVTAYAAPGAVYPAAVAYPAGRAVTVRPKVYVQGQPIRNMFRAITP